MGVETAYPQNPRQPAAAPRQILLPESLTREWVSASDLVRIRPQTSLMLDFSNTRQIDSAGAALVHVLTKEHARFGLQVTVTNISKPVLDILNRATTVERPATPVKPAESLFTRIGDSLLKAAQTAAVMLSVLVEMLYWGTFGLLKRRDFRRGVLLEQMYLLGYKALGIVLTLGILIGIVLAQQTAMQLRELGAGIFLAQLITWSMVRELGPLLTAIILAGRTGSATTAEIATMVVSEEIDALRTMGLNPVQFVVVPKFWAISLTMPLLSIITTAAGIMGGYLVSLFYLDIPSSLFWGEVGKLRIGAHFTVGLTKSIVFSWIIIWLGSFFGLRVHGGAEAVGRETTASVVACLFAIIIADAVFSYIFLNF